MRLQFAYYNAGQLVVVGCVEGHETQLCPLIEEVSVHIDAVGLGQVLRYQFADLGKVLGLFLEGILDVADAGRMLLEIGTWGLDLARGFRSRLDIAAHCNTNQDLTRPDCHCTNEASIKKNSPQLE